MYRKTIPPMDTRMIMIPTRRFSIHISRILNHFFTLEMIYARQNHQATAPIPIHKIPPAIIQKEYSDATKN